MKKQRYAIYTRNSSDMQNEISLEDQETVCRQAIAERDGIVVALYSDSAKSGWNLDRKGFSDLQRDAGKGLFDAIMFWKFDRLARNHDHAIMIKALLRHEFGLQLYCVEGFSEDDDDSEHTALMEQLIAVFAAFYSKNLSTETKRGKKQRAMRGEFNGSVPPFGYNLITKKTATDEYPAGLYINPRQAVIVRRAFRMYASGKHSDTTVAEWMNSLLYVQRLRENSKPIGKEMVRDMLKNRTYTGRVPYSDTQYSKGLGQGKKSSRNRREWFEGKHQGFISDELYESCQLAREQLTSKRRLPEVMHTYVLHNRVYCARCLSSKPNDLIDKNYGKMRPSWNNQSQHSYYRCLARGRGYHDCGQSIIDTNWVDEQVVDYLSKMLIPQEFRQSVEMAINKRIENEQDRKRMAEIDAIIKRIDFSWEEAFLKPEEYIAKRNQLNQEIEISQQIHHDDLIESSDLIDNFGDYWTECTHHKVPQEARKRLLTKIVKKVFVYDEQVLGIMLYGNLGVVLDDGSTSHELVVSLTNVMKNDGNVIIHTFV